MEYHTAIKNDGPVKEYLTTWGNVHKILLRTKKKKKKQVAKQQAPYASDFAKTIIKKRKPRAPEVIYDIVSLPPRHQPH